jgi:hypothetical protein
MHSSAAEHITPTGQVSFMSRLCMTEMPFVQQNACYPLSPRCACNAACMQSLQRVSMLSTQGLQNAANAQLQSSSVSTSICDRMVHV